MPGPRPIVYGCASVAGLGAAQRARLDLRPPVQRHDLAALLDAGPPGTVVLLDGLFGTRLAVSIMECADLLRAGWTVCGASSIGALRAAELWSLGMVGIGEIYTMLRLGAIASDVELAVLYHPDTLEELTVSTVQVRSVLQALVAAGAVAGTAVDRLAAAAQEIHWTQRSTTDVGLAWREAGLPVETWRRAEELLRDARFHPKVADGALAVRSVLAGVWVQPGEQGGRR